MSPGAHEGPETSFGGKAIRGDVDDVLHLGVVEEKTVDGAVAALDEAGCEAVDVETFYALLFAVAAADEFNKCFRVVGVEVYYFFVETFV